MSLLLLTATLFGGVALGVAITFAAFYFAAVKEFADTAENNFGQILGRHNR